MQSRAKKQRPASQLILCQGGSSQSSCIYRLYIYTHTHNTSRSTLAERNKLQNSFLSRKGFKFSSLFSIPTALEEEKHTSRTVLVTLHHGINCFDIKAVVNFSLVSPIVIQSHYRSFAGIQDHRVLLQRSHALTEVILSILIPVVPCLVWNNAVSTYFVFTSVAY